MNSDDMSFMANEKNRGDVKSSKIKKIGKIIRGNSKVDNKRSRF